MRRFSAEIEAQEIKEGPYDALDFQLADLLQRLNGQADKLLEKMTLEVSKQRREGQIAIPCSQTEQAHLLSTPVVGVAGDYKPLIIDQGYLYLHRYWQYQQQLAGQIKARVDLPTGPAESGNSAPDLGIDNEWLDQKLAHYFKQVPDDETIDWQQVAVKRALEQHFFILSGGPGTGKTTTLARLLALLIEQHLVNQDLGTPQNESKTVKTGGGVLASASFNILLAAPTGKAAVRMLDSLRSALQVMDLEDAVKQLLPAQAVTLHKLLGYQPGSVHFKHQRNNPLQADVVLVDEASMVDIALMQKLFDAVPLHAKLILIGDKDQLASVETGSVFSDICTAFETQENLVTLQKNWRFAAQSGIGKLAKAVNQGSGQTVLQIIHDPQYSECNLLSPKLLDRRELRSELLAPWDTYFDCLNQKERVLDDIFKAFNQYRILCALRRGLNGSDSLNQRIEHTLMHRGKLNPKQGSSGRWYHGRPVMITQNSTSKGFSNGDTGIALIYQGELKVYFPDGEAGHYKAVAPVRLPPHETAWAMTIHKSQGSEFDNVTLVLPHEEMPLLSRQLIYTGITRAKQKVTIIADEAVLRAGVETSVATATRITQLLP